MTDQMIIIQSLLIGAVLCGIYQWLYRGQKRFLTNRFFLVLSLLMMLVLPFVTLELIPVSSTERQVVPLQKVGAIASEIPQQTTNWLHLAYWVGVGVFAITFMVRLIGVLFFIIRGRFVQSEDGLYVARGSYKAAFSFFNYIFLHDTDNEIVFTHEAAHSIKKHSIDKVFVEVMQIFLWCNPFYYIIRYFVAENHEFEADHIAIGRLGVTQEQYVDKMVSYLKQVDRMSIAMTHDFHSIIKNRINMLLNQSQPKKVVYALLVPILMSIVGASTIRTYPVYQNAESILVDTIPANQILVDTIVTFDTETYEEKVRVVKSINPAIVKYLDALPKSGETFAIMDTITTFDASTYEEKVQVVKTVLPLEVYKAMAKYDFDTQWQIMQQYAIDQK